MHEQFALSFDGKASPALALCGEAEGQPNLLPSTWGFGWYPDNQRAATVVRDPSRALPSSPTVSQDRFGEAQSSLFLGHSHGIHQASNDVEPQPYVKSYAARQWLFSIAGDLSPELRTVLSLDESFDIAPVGTSVGEHALSWIVAEIRREGCRTIEELGWPRLQQVLFRLNELGAASFLLSDGIDLVAYRDAHDRIPLHWARLTPPHLSTRIEGRTVTIDFDGPLDVSRTLLAISTYPMRGASWMPMEPGELRVARRGTFVWSSHPNGIDEQVFSFLRLSPPRSRTASYSPYPHGTGEQQQLATASPPLAPQTRPSPDVAVLSVVHETIYRYAIPVERSTHRFCLR
ncbi:class II glutamine amidotransferase, partial [Myxococcota bacterium]|nr:class II glutamine amidotransferase [Myxococcota bacterium]